jgi:hypothetical protein
MARQYDVEGTKSYLTAAIILALLAAWHIFDGWVPQERWLEKYPNFPETWYDFRLHEFYAYNRWTGVIFAIAAAVCAYIHKVVK